MCIRDSQHGVGGVSDTFGICGPLLHEQEEVDVYKRQLLCFLYGRCGLRSGTDCTRVHFEKEDVQVHERLSLIHIFGIG